jgi:hypothetical protein
MTGFPHEAKRGKFDLAITLFAAFYDRLRRKIKKS